MALPIVCQAKRSRWLALALVMMSAAACARTGLYPGEVEDGEATDSGGASASSGGALPQPMPTTTPSATAGGATKPSESPPECEPRAETCNGQDDDCDGSVDDLAPEACPGGGYSYCVAGRLSECPRRCEVCVPGSVRICQNPFCTFWGEQECAADGQGFGSCRESNPPIECAAVAQKFEESRELEQCCIDNGYCCVDEFDLDRDGDRREMLGACGDVACQ